MSMPKLLRRLMIVYFFIFMAAPVSYLIRILYARSLSVEAYGLFYAMIALIGLVGAFNDLGMNPALVHYLPKFIKEKSYKKIKSAMSIVFGVEIITAVIVAIVLLSAKEFIASSFLKTSLALAVIPIFAFVFFLENIFEVMVNIFKGYRKELLYSSSNPLRLLAVLVMSFIAYLFFNENLLVAFSLIWVISFILMVAVYAYPFAKLNIKPLKQKMHFDSEIFSMLLKYGVFVMLTAAAGMLLSRIDVLMIAYFKGMSDVAFYEIALPIATIIFTVITPLSSFLFPTISHYYHARQTKIIKLMLQAIYNTGFFLFLPLCLIFFLFPQEIIIVLFGAKYVPAKIALKILAIGFIFKGFSSINFSVADGIGKIKFKSMIIYLGAALNIILNIALIPTFGIEGAAIATSISFFAMFLTSIWYLEKKIKFGPSYKNWLKTIINSAVFVAIVYFLKTMLSLNIYLESAIVILISLAIYLAIGLIWGILDYKTLKSTFLQALRQK